MLDRLQADLKASMLARDTQKTGVLRMALAAYKNEAVAKGLGLPAVSCSTAEDFEKAFAGAMAQTGPMFIEAPI